jgi:hypothetical protein
MRQSEYSYYLFVIVPIIDAMLYSPFKIGTPSQTRAGPGEAQRASVDAEAEARAEVNYCMACASCHASASGSNSSYGSLKV